MKFTPLTLGRLGNDINTVRSCMKMYNFFPEVILEKINNTSFHIFLRHKVSLAYPPHGPKDRFKVVKIVSSLPLRRGRWNVVDYPDKEKTSKETSSGIPTSGISSSVPPQASVVPPSVGYANVDTSETGSMVR